MSRSPLIRLALALMITLAVPLAIDAWLRGAHVTIEQRASHQRAVAVYGVHHHGLPVLSQSHHGAAPSDGGAQAERADAGLILSRLTQLSTMTSWEVLALLLLLMTAPSVGRLRYSRAGRTLAGWVPTVPPPPPRSLLVG